LPLPDGAFKSATAVGLIICAVIATERPLPSIILPFSAVRTPRELPVLSKLMTATGPEPLIGLDPIAAICTGLVPVLLAFIMPRVRDPNATRGFVSVVES
jgi:hypothetical protein